MPSSSSPSAFARVAALPDSLPDSFTPSDPIRVVEVSNKYLPPGPAPNVSGVFPYLVSTSELRLALGLA